MAALGRVDRLVHPFPRSLWIRRGTLERAGFPDAADRATIWMDKLLLDIEEIQSGSLGEAASIDHVIVLKDPAEVQRGIQENLVPEVCVTVDRLDDALIDAISQNDCATGVQVDAGGKYPTLRFRSAQSSLILSHIEKLCRRQKILVLDVTKGERGRPSFEEHARLEDIPKSQAAMELLGRFQGGYMSELLHDEFGGNSARLFMELSAFVGQAQCYKLFVGPLHEMADLVCDIAGT